jgi:leader peptidase (prepilin peptidase) / N-methyltransferase
MNFQTGSTFALTCLLAAIAWIDWRRFVIPNELNLALAASGVIVSVLVLGHALVSVLAESAITIAAFLLIGKIYGRVRGKAGLGGGDIKFLGAAAAWVGALGIPWVVLFASISGLIFVVACGISGNCGELNKRIAFGPHLSLALIAVWLLQDVIVQHS